MPKHIMFFNDSKEMLLLVEGVLHNEGYEVFLEALGSEEVEHIKALKPDLVILDSSTDQEEYGWNIISQLRMIPETAAIPVILCIMPIRRTNEIKAHLSTKRVVLLNKPYAINDLLLTIKQAFKVSEVMQDPETDA
jgi:CheY-like chemotaxis protein